MVTQSTTRVVLKSSRSEKNRVAAQKAHTVEFHESSERIKRDRTELATLNEWIVAPPANASASPENTGARDSPSSRRSCVADGRKNRPTRIKSARIGATAIKK